MIENGPRHVIDRAALEAITLEQVPTALLELAAAHEVLIAKLLDRPRALRAGDATLIDSTAAARMLGVTIDWLYRRAHEFSFAHKIGGQWRFDTRGIEEHLRKRGAPK